MFTVVSGWLAGLPCCQAQDTAVTRGRRTWPGRRAQAGQVDADKSVWRKQSRYPKISARASQARTATALASCDERRVGWQPPAGAGVAFTLDRFGHPYEDTVDETPERLDALLFQRLAPKL